MTAQIKLTPEERAAIAALKKVAEAWPDTLWLFATGMLHVMRVGPDGKREMGEPGSNTGVDQDYCVGTIDIPNDGGGW